MRVIAGSAKRIQLKTVDGLETRPTTDRIKETLFNMIQPNIYNTNFLDLFSGSGAIGIEALSRGARHAVFIEMNLNAIRCIQENLTKTKLSEQADVVKQEVISSLQLLDGRDKFDFIFMDPPYNQELEKKVLDKIRQIDILEEDATIIVEAALETDFSYLEDLGYRLVKSKEYRTNKHVFIELKGE